MTITHRSIKWTNEIVQFENMSLVKCQTTHYIFYILRHKKTTEERCVDLQNKYSQKYIFDGKVCKMRYIEKILFASWKKFSLGLSHAEIIQTSLFFFLQSIDDLPNVDAILVVYSVDDEQSFNEAVQNIQFIRKEKVCNQAIILVANKADLERRRVVSEKGILVYQDCSLAWTLVWFWDVNNIYQKFG